MAEPLQYTPERDWLDSWQRTSGSASGEEAPGSMEKEMESTGLDTQV